MLRPCERQRRKRSSVTRDATHVNLAQPWTTRTTVVPVGLSCWVNIEATNVLGFEFMQQTTLCWGECSPRYWPLFAIQIRRERRLGTTVLGRCFTRGASHAKSVPTHWARSSTLEQGTQQSHHIQVQKWPLETPRPSFRRPQCNQAAIQATSAPIHKAPQSEP